MDTEISISYHSPCHKNLLIALQPSEMVKPSSAGRPSGQQVAGGRTRCTLLLVEQKPASSRRDQDLTPNPGDFSPQPAPCLGGCLPFSGSVPGVKSAHTTWQACHQPAQSGKSSPQGLQDATRFRLQRSRTSRAPPGLGEAAPRGRVAQVLTGRASSTRRSKAAEARAEPAPLAHPPRPPKVLA